MFEYLPPLTAASTAGKSYVSPRPRTSLDWPLQKNTAPNVTRCSTSSTPASAAAQPLAHATVTVQEPPAGCGGTSTFQAIGAAVALCTKAQPFSQSATEAPASPKALGELQPPQKEKSCQPSHVLFAGPPPQPWISAQPAAHCA